MTKFNKNCDFFAENERFSRLIKYYAKRIKCDSAELDLWEFLFFLLKSERGIINDNYIAVCLRNEYIRLSKKVTSEREKICEINLDIATVYDGCFDGNIDIKKALFRLTDKERETIILHYYQGYSLKEIARAHGVSRQAVNTTKNRALEKLRNSVI